MIRELECHRNQPGEWRTRFWLKALIAEVDFAQSQRRHFYDNPLQDR